MAKKTGNLAAMKQRAAKAAAVVAAPAGQAAAATAAPAAPKKPFNPMRFFGEVRAEARKITWTSRKETWITSVMVFIMVLIAALFFFVVDWLLSGAVALLLKLANAG
ncbi:SecE Preprotein translocase subunit SecE [Caulobacteraceae bacterium]|jgi:preprotein translocase subunit SecE